MLAYCSFKSGRRTQGPSGLLLLYTAIHLRSPTRFALHLLQVAPGEAVTLPHLSLLQAGKLRLLFCVNAGAVRRTLRRSRANAIRQDG